MIAVKCGVNCAKSRLSKKKLNKEILYKRGDVSLGFNSKVPELLNVTNLTSVDQVLLFLELKKLTTPRVSFLAFFKSP